MSGGRAGGQDTGAGGRGGTRGPGGRTGHQDTRTLGPADGVVVGGRGANWTPGQGGRRPGAWVVAGD